MGRNIHKPYRKLKGVLREKGITYKELANALGVSETAINHKINGKSDFYLSELKNINEKFKIENNIFFTA